MIKINLIAASICSSLSVFLNAAFAEDSFPNKPIKVIIGFAPGGPTDSIGRVLFSKVGEALKTPMIIDNRPGAGGNIGSQELAKASADGYTVMYGSSSITTAPPLFGRDDLNPYTSFDAVTCTSSVPLLLLASKKLPVNTAAELYELLKNNPGKYFAGTSGVGSLDHLLGADISDQLSLKVDDVPYKGNGPALTDLAAGNVDFMYSGSFNSARPFLDRCDVKALAVTSDVRSSALPNVPTLSESVDGLRGYSGGTWQAVLVPKGTPDAVKDKLNQAIVKALGDKSVRDSLDFQGATVMTMTPEQCQAFIGTEYDRWEKKIKQLGLNAKSS